MILIGLLLFLIILYVHRHTYIKKECYQGCNLRIDRKKVPCPLYLVILMGVISIVPILNIVVFLTGSVVYISSITYGVYTFIPDKMLSKIIKFFSREV